MRRVAILAAVLAAAIGSAKCSQSPAANVLAPSSVEAGAAATAAKGGGGGKGKPGGGGATGGGSLSLAMSADTNADGAPNWGDTITWNVSTTATDTPTVNVECSQNGVAVYGATAGFYASYPWPWTVNMRLASNDWSSGAANCTARLTPVSGSPVLASYSFSVAP